jgi:hypothetical protein
MQRFGGFFLWIAKLSTKFSISAALRLPTFKAVGNLAEGPEAP